MIGCTSWGLYQLMGVNVFDPRYPKDPETPLDPPDVFAFVGDAGMQDVLFSAFLRAEGISYTLDELLADDVKMATFARAYNGPGNVQAYSDLIRARAAGQVSRSPERWPPARRCSAEPSPPNNVGTGQ